MVVELVMKTHRAMLETNEVRKRLDACDIVDDYEYCQELAGFLHEKTLRYEALINASLAQLETIGDERMACILLHHYMLNFTWREVARLLKDGSSARTVKRDALRYLEAHGGADGLQ